MGNLCGVTEDEAKGYARRLNEASNGKDTMTGHWEMMGIYTTKPFVTFTDHGFPKELIDELEKRTGRKIIGNKAASGTEILDELAEREIENGELIVYTSADSVLQICGNEETMGLETLYHYCEIARELTMKDEWKVGRVIARPYVGKKKGEFVRTANRHDYAVKPTGKTVLNAMQEAGYDVISIGKINDIFCGEGITESLKSKSSVHGMEQTIETAGKDFTGLCFVNLVDFDALWGHRRNPEGYGKEIEKFDVNLGKLLEQLKDDDLLLITADHGNDPTYTGTDHTREQVPLLAYSPSMKESGPSGDEGHLRCDRRIRCRELRRKNAGGNDRNIDPGIVEIRKRWRFQLSGKNLSKVSQAVLLRAASLKLAGAGGGCSGAAWPSFPRRKTSDPDSALRDKRGRIPRAWKNSTGSWNKASAFR